MAALFHKYPHGAPVMDQGIAVSFFTVESQAFSRQMDALTEDERAVVVTELSRIYDQALEKLAVYRTTPTQFDYRRAFGGILLDFHVLIGFVPRGESKPSPKRGEFIFAYVARGELTEALDRVFPNALEFQIETLEESA